MSNNPHWHCYHENMNMALVLVLSKWGVSIKLQEARMTKTPIPFDLASEHKHQSIDARMTRMFLA